MQTKASSGKGRALKSARKHGAFLLPKTTAGKKAGQALLRTALFTALLATLLLLCFALQGVRMKNIYRVIVPHLNVRDQPRLQGAPFYILEQGNHVKVRNQEVEQDGYPWVRVAFRWHPQGAALREWKEGWVARQGTSGDPFLEEETSPVRKTILASNLTKWKATGGVYHLLQASSLPRSVKRAAFYHPDKALHMVFMAVLGCTLFVVFLLAARGLPYHALLVSLALTNLLGLVNEGLDLVTGKGAFELRDLAANILGSGGALLPFFLYMLGKRFLTGARDSRSG